MRISLYREVIDYLRRHHSPVDYGDPRERDGRTYRQISVPKQVEIKMIMEDLPLRITDFIIKRDRFKYGHGPVLAVVTLLLCEGEASPVMLRNWFQVNNPNHCVCFVVLLTRHFLYLYRERYRDMLGGVSFRVIDDVGSRVDVL